MRIEWTIAVAMIVTATPAVAQRDTEQYGRPIDTPENRERMAVVGSSFCAQREASATAAKVLASAIGSNEEAKAVKSLRGVAVKCYQPQWPTFPPTEVRNALAQIDYREHHKSVPATTPPGKSPPESFAVVPTGTTGTPEQESAWYLAALANCVVFVDPPAVHNLLIGPAGVDEENKRFDRLKPALATCGPRDGVPGMSARVFRGYLANALLMRVRTEK